MGRVRKARGDAMTDEIKSMGELETLQSAEGKASPEEALSLGEQETLRGWGILEEWGGKRWKAGEEILGRYVVTRELGQGGMGVVYECLDKVGGVKVAVKALPPELSHNSVEMEEVRENFELVYKLNHPNIASVKTLERDGKGEYFLVMDVAEGVSLRKWLRDKRKAGGVSPNEVVGVLRQVAAALDYAHAKKVVHRDVKPGNVMIDPSGEVKVLDFGLAAQIRTSLSRASQAYRGTSGTGPYMAPEQWLGKPQDGKADQYALAVMAYEMLAGRLPFENSELAVLKDAVLRGEADSIPGIPKGAMRALRRAMAKRKEERFGSCGEFVEALGGTGGRRNARGKTLMGWVAVLALVGAGVWWWGKQTPVAETAGEPPAPPGETRLEAASPEELAEAAAKEEARLAEEKAAEEEARRLEEERVRAEREEKIRQESEELEETVYRLAPLAKTKAENAGGMGYDRGQGFGEKLDEMKEKLQQGEAAMGGRNFKKAKAWFEESMALAGWCEENAPLREAAGRAKGAAEEAKKKAEAMDGAHLGLTAWRKGEKAREKAETAWEKAEFRAATAGWNEAGAAYGESEKAARAAKVEQGLEAARGAKGRGAWEAVITAADGVLALDGGNADAKKLKEEAVGMLKPTIVPKATPDGRAAAAGEVFPLDLGGGVSLEMVHCPGVAGDFWMGKTEVTQEQWQRVIGKNPSHFTGKPKNPVETVSWNDCQEFVKKVNSLPAARASGLLFRLPTEEEWKASCRAGAPTSADSLSFRLPTEEEWKAAFHAGAPKSADYCKLADGTQITEVTLSRVAWFNEDWNTGSTHLVGTKDPNAWGLHDMHGNVREWTQTAVGGFYVNGGGSFRHAARYCAAGNPTWSYPEGVSRCLGLRLAASGRAAAR